MTTPSATCPTCGKPDCKIIDELLENHNRHVDAMLTPGLPELCPGSGTPATAGGDRAASPQDWTEDAKHENGKYWNLCHVCSRNFVGHKRRVTCKLCVAPAAPAGDVRDDSFERLSSRYHEAPADPFWDALCGDVLDEWKRAIIDRNTIRHQHAHDAEQIAKLRARLKVAEPYLPAEFRAALKREEERE